MRIEAFICDECKATKGQANHWWQVFTDVSGFHTQAWTDEAANAKGIRHLCGQQCVHKTIDRWMLTGRLETG